MEKLCICYHGTSKENAKTILKKGFRARTYFARHLEDAIGFGGNYVFEVMFKKKILPETWQFIIARKRHPKFIVRLKHYPKIKLLKENKKLGKKIFNSNI